MLKYLSEISYTPTFIIEPEKPVLESFTVYADHADIEFSKYMVSDSVSALKLLNQYGETIPYILKDIESEKEGDGVTVFKTYTLRFEDDWILTPNTECKLIFLKIV